MARKRETADFSRLLQGHHRGGVAINSVHPHGRVSWVVIYKVAAPGSLERRVAIVTELPDGSLMRRTDFECE